MSASLHQENQRRRRVQRATYWPFKFFVKASENACKARIVHPIMDGIRLAPLFLSLQNAMLWTWVTNNCCVGIIKLCKTLVSYKPTTNNPPTFTVLQRMCLVWTTGAERLVKGERERPVIKQCVSVLLLWVISGEASPTLQPCGRGPQLHFVSLSPLSGAAVFSSLLLSGCCLLLPSFAWCSLHVV